MCIPNTAHNNTTDQSRILDPCATCFVSQAQSLCLRRAGKTSEFVIIFSDLWINLPLNWLIHSIHHFIRALTCSSRLPNHQSHISLTRHGQQASWAFKPLLNSKLPYQAIVAQTGSIGYESLAGAQRKE